MFYEIKGIEKGNVLENTFEKSKNQNPSKKVWDLKKKWDFVGGSRCKKTSDFEK